MSSFRTTPRKHRRRLGNRLGGALVGLLALTLTACASSPPTPLPPVPPATESPGGAPAAPGGPSCDNATVSYAPAAGIPDGSTMAAIRDRGRLVAGISADSYLLGSRNPLTGEIEGFDIDLVHAIADEILGPGAPVQLRVITAADRIPVLENHEVDVVVRNMTMTCDRWEQIGFSAEYYSSGQKLLVRKGSPITGIENLGTSRVCAPRGTSTIAQIRQLAPDAVTIGADSHTACLMLFQQAEVDAITGDDTVLAGLAAQDPYAVIINKPAFTHEPYGVGIPADHVDMIRFTNALLEEMRRDGRWQQSYDRWFAPTLGPATQPEPKYGRSER